MENETTSNNSESSSSMPQSAQPVSPMMSKKTAVIIVLIAALAALIYYFKGTIVAATVNGRPISRLAVVRELESRSGKDALDSLITEALISSEAKKNNITISREEIDAELKSIEDQVTASGQTLEDALEAQGTTRKNLERQIMIRKQVEKMLADKTNVSDQEVDSYIQETKLTIPKGKEAETKNQVREQLKDQKFNEVASQWVAELREKASIRYFVEY